MNFVTRPVTIFAAFLAVVVGANLWYNYFGLTVSEKGFHGVMPYKSIVPQYTEFVLSKESKDERIRTSEARIISLTICTG